jgi:hypothetical protein
LLGLVLLVIEAGLPVCQATIELTSQPPNCVLCRLLEVLEGQFVVDGKSKAAADVVFRVAVLNLANLSRVGIAPSLIAFLREADDIAQRVSPSVVGVKGKAFGETALEGCLQRVVVGDAFAGQPFDLTNVRQKLLPVSTCPPSRYIPAQARRVIGRCVVLGSKNLSRRGNVDVVEKLGQMLADVANIANGQDVGSKLLFHLQVELLDHGGFSLGSSAKNVPRAAVLMFCPAGVGSPSIEVCLVNGRRAQSAAAWSLSGDGGGFAAQFA